MRVSVFKTRVFAHLRTFHPMSFYRRASRFVVFQTKVEHSCFCLVRKQMPLLIYIYAIESKICPRLGLFWVKNLAKVESKIGPRRFFACFFPVPWPLGVPKTHKQCVGVRTYLLLQAVKASKKGGSTKCMFCFCLFSVGESEREKMKTKTFLKKNGIFG